MRTIVCEQLGKPTGLVLREQPKPDPPRADEVKVQLKAWGLNFVDVLMVAGGYQLKPELPFVPGMEISVALLAAFGSKAALLVYLATIGALAISFLVGRFMTLRLIDHGMVEANPFMAALLGQGTGIFASTKIAMTGTSILILVFLAKSRFLNRVRTGLVLTVFFTLYACLVCYEFVHLMRVI